MGCESARKEHVQAVFSSESPVEGNKRSAVCGCIPSEELQPALFRVPYT